MVRPVVLVAGLLLFSGFSAAFFGATPFDVSQPSQEIGPIDRSKIEAPFLAAVTATPAEQSVPAIVYLAPQADVADVMFQRDLVVGRFREVARQSQADLVAYLEAQGLRVHRGFWIVNALSVEGTPSQVLEATRASLVARIGANFEVEVLGKPIVAMAPPSSIAPQPEPLDVSVTWGLERIRAPEIWSQLNVQGEGVRVCVSDTGVDISHPDLQGRMWTDAPGDPTYPGGWIEFNANGVPVPGSEPHDTHGHGTHTSGTVLGGAASGVAIGVAPRATLMHALILPGGSGYFSQVIAGIEWCVDPIDGNGSPAGQPAGVQSMSWGANGQYDDLIAPIRNSWYAGVIPVAAASNCGEGCSGSPGNVFESIGIGASDESDGIASFSSGQRIEKTMWGNPPADWPDEWIVPDVSAPGVNVYSSLPDGSYAYWAGTSMATPHVAGCVALMKSVNPGLTPDRALFALTLTAVWYDRYAASPPDIRYGAGRIDCLEATVEVASNSGVEGTIRDSADLTPLDQTRVSASDGTSVRLATTSSGGAYRIYLRPGTYNVTAQRFGYSDGVATAVRVDPEAWTQVDLPLIPMPSGTLTGRTVASLSGLAVPGATVTIAGIPIVLKASTDASGAFAFPKLPAGTYSLLVTSPYFVRAQPSGINVVADAQTDVTIPLNARPRVAVFGDFMTDNTAGRIGRILERNDFLVEYIGMWGWGQAIANPCRYQAIVLNGPGDPGPTTFNDFLAATDAAATGVVFLDSWALFGDAGIAVMRSNLGDPVVRTTGYDFTSPETYFEVRASHPILGGAVPGDRITFDNTSFWHMYAWFDGYVGENGVNLADIGVTNSGVVGRSIAVDDRANNRHVLLSSYGASYYSSPGDWTEDAEALFVRALTWAMRPTPCSDAIVVDWGLTVDPAVGLWSDTFNVTVRAVNVGLDPDNYTAALYVNGGYEASQTVPLAPGDVTTVLFPVRRDPVGSYTAVLGPYTTSFRIRPPTVSVSANGLDELPLVNAAIDAILGGTVRKIGSLDANGQLSFASPGGSHGDYWVVVRGADTAGREHFLAQRVYPDKDATYAFDAVPAETAPVILAMDAVGNGHTGELRVRPSGTQPGVEAAFPFPPGTFYAYLGTYEAVFLMSIPGIAGTWSYEAAPRSLNLAGPAGLEVRYGGTLRAPISASQSGNTVTVDWSVTDSYGNRLASVATDSIGFLAGTRTVRYPLVTLWSGAGDLLVAGYVAWTQSPATTTVPQGATVAFAQLDLDAGPYPLVNVFELNVSLKAADGRVVPDGSTVATLAVDVVGTALRLGEQIPVTITVNGASVAVDTQGAFLAPVALQEGLNEISVDARDLAGNVRREEFNILAKTSVLLAIHPVASPTNQTAVTVQGVVESGATVTVSGNPVPVDGSGSFSVVVPLVEGANAIRVRASDSYGNVNEIVLSVTRDTLPPALAILTPSNGAITRDATVTVIGNTEVRASVTVAGIPVDASSGVFQVDVPLVEGANDIVVRAADAAGNRVQAVVRATRDTTPPALSVASPQDRAVTKEQTLTVQGTVEVGASVSVNGVAVPATGGQFAASVSLTEGANLLMIVATDAAENRAEVLRIITLDTTTPFLAVTAPANGMRTSAGEIEVRGSVEAGAAVTVNGLSPLRDGDNFAATIALIEGTNTIVVRATDAAGNVREVQIEVIRKTRVALEIDWIEVLPGSTEILVQGRTDPGAAIRVNGIAAVVSMDGSFEVVVPVTGEEVTLDVEAFDGLGNRAATSIVVRVFSPLSGPDNASAVAAAGLSALVAGLGAAVLALWVYWRHRKNRSEPEVEGRIR